LIRRLFKKLTGGEYVYRSSWEPKTHSCRLPSGHKGDVWKCNCGKLWKCLGLSAWADVIMWREIKESEIHSDTDENEIF
jgi:hypothetical protein